MFRKVFCLVNFIFFFNFSASDFNIWDSDTYVPDICVCVPEGKCSYAGDTPNTDGSGIIQARIATNGDNPKSNLGTNKTMCQPVSTGISIAADSMTECEDGLEVCCPSIGYSCGIRYPPVTESLKTANNQAAYGAYPYQAVILTNFNLYIASGVLIDQYHVLTVAHKVYNLSTPLKIRLGDWDALDNYEPLPVIERNVSVYIHENFSLPNLKNNIAILRLNSMIPLGKYPTIGTICLPNTTLSDMYCWVSGWGKNSTDETGRYQRIIKEVNVPLVDHTSCLNMLRLTRLGRSFMLDKFSFTCAGGETGKDACTGDGGAPLSCFVGDRFYLNGLVAWGLDCGQTNVPGVYVNIQSFIPWIQNTTKKLSSMSYKQTTKNNILTTTKGQTSSIKSSIMSTLMVKNTRTTERLIKTTTRVTNPRRRTSTTKRRVTNKAKIFKPPVAP